MNSENPASECFVYITLPGQTQAVTAGRFALTTDRRGTALGRFVYGRSYLARNDAVEIDPVELKLSGETYATSHLNGVKLQQIAAALIRDELSEADTETIQVQDLMLLGTSMGGARPKAVVEDDEGLWVAKFNRPDDRWNHARVEHAMLELARRSHISAAASRIVTVGANDVLLVRRFDREKTARGYTRARVISGLTLLRADEAAEARDRWSYVLMAEELRRVVAEPKKDARELFRRMCFNALISNIDDHPRNHALLAKDRDWKLSPAYDLTPSPAIAQDRRDLAMSCGDMGRFANAKNILSQCARFLLDENEAKSIVSEMTDQVRATWYDIVRAGGASEKDAETIRRAFVYEGFSRPT